jgi:hypothetical protein
MNIELWNTNPYSIGEAIKTLDGDIVLLREPVSYLPSEKDKLIAGLAGQPLDKISFKQYDKQGEDSGKLYWYISDTNPAAFDLMEVSSLPLLIPDYVNFTKYI